MTNPFVTLPSPAWLAGPEDQELSWVEELEEAVSCAHEAMKCRQQDVFDAEKLRIIHEGIAHFNRAEEKIRAERSNLARSSQ